MKYMHLYYATTNTLLLDIYNIKVNHFPDEPADLYIFDHGHMSSDLVSEIIKSNIFEEVIIINLVNIVPKFFQGNTTSKSPIKQICDIPFKVISRMVTLQRLTSSLKKYSNKIYDIIFIPGFYIDSLYLVHNAYKYNPNIHIRFVEHGATCFYLSFKTVCNPHLDLSGSKRAIILYNLFWMIYTGISNNKAKEQYEKRVDGYHSYNIWATDQLTLENSNNRSIVAYQIRQISNENKPVVDLLNNLLDGGGYNEYLSKNYYYLATEDAKSTHPMHHLFLEQIIDLSKIVGNHNIIIKSHPGLPISRDKNIHNDIYIDERKYFFESLYSKIDLSEKIIIAHSSGAAFHPKYMFNSEPYVIFTYKLYPENSVSPFNNIMLEKMIKDLINAYSDKNKIMIPKSIDEFKMILESLNHSINCSETIK